jgi:hypothetical protein
MQHVNEYSNQLTKLCVCCVKKIAKLRHGNPFGPNVCVTYSAEDEGAAAGAAGALPESDDADELGAGVVPDFPLSVL